MTHLKSEKAVAKFDLRAIEKGHIVSRPVGDYARYDRIIDIDGKLHRVQIKYVGGKPSHSAGAVALNLQNGRTKEKYAKYRTYSPSEIDALVLYIPQIDELLWLNPKQFAGKTGLTLRLEPSKNNQKKGIILAQDYIW